MKLKFIYIAVFFFFCIEYPLSSQEKPYPKVFKTSQGMPMIFVKGGTYTMGTEKIYEIYETNDVKDFRPAHEVTLSPFYMAKYEITKGMFKIFSKETGIAKDNRHLDPNSAKLNDGGPSYRNAPGDDYPMPDLTWVQANAFCNWLSLKEGRSYRLPTEAEWEFIARAGTDTLHWWGDDFKAMMCIDRGTGFRDYSFPAYWIHGTFPANPWGFNDLYSNVNEWTIDSYKKYSKKSQKDPLFFNKDDKENKVLRGGSILSLSLAMNSYYRMYESGIIGKEGGIRLVCEITKDFKIPDEIPPEPIITKPSYEVKVHGFYDVAISDQVKIRMIEIPKGSFKQGSPEIELFHYPSESPQLKVEFFEPYWMSETEVTQEQYGALLGYNPSEVKGKLFPVTNITYWEAMYYVRKLTENERAAGRFTAEEEYRLPMEGEWEYACRAGTKTMFYYGNEVELLKNYANYENLEGVKSVKQKFPNPWGLYDMMGNVSELCFNHVYLYNNKYKKESELMTKNGLIIDLGDTSMIYSRGGAWNLGLIHCRSAMRGQFNDKEKYNFVGFRIARGKKYIINPKTEKYINFGIDTYFEKFSTK